MNAVISRAQAKQITGGRTPLVPVEYETAVKSLQACLTLDEAKYWSDKSDALAAWAKIYRNDEAGRKAKMLKLHAYRRMGTLAHELRPARLGARPGGGGCPPGPVSLLVESGLPIHKAAAASAIAKLPERKFESFLSRDFVPAPSQLMPKHSAGTSDAWKEIVSAHGGTSLVTFRAFCRRVDAKSARKLSADEAVKAREILQEVTEWLDEFESNLPKERKR